MKSICVEIDGVFYKSCRQAGQILRNDRKTIKRRCLSDKFPNYKFVSYRFPKEKKCSKCGITKPLSEFYKDSNSKDEHEAICKKCEKTYKKQHYQINKERISKQHKKYYQRNKKKTNHQQKEYRQKNKKKIAKYKKEWQKERRENDPAFKLNKNMSSAIYRSLKRKKNGAPWKTLVPYAIKELKEHLIFTLPEGCTWDDYLERRLHLDHIIPLSLWNITSTKCKGFKGAWALENLRLIPAEENLRKSNKLFY